MSNQVSIEELRRFAEKFVAEEPERLGTDGWWQAPLLTAAPVDERFDKLPKIADCTTIGLHLKVNTKQ